MAGTCARYGIATRTLYSRRRTLEGKLGRQIIVNDQRLWVKQRTVGEIQGEIKNGCMIVGGDAHYWPGIVSTAHRAFVEFCKEFKPRTVVMNGDIFDGASVSRHAPIGWEERPAVLDELEACQERLAEIEDAAPRGSRLVWPLGNHDARFESRIAQQAPEYARVKGVHLKDHFSDRWEPCWLFEVNNSVVVKHRFKGGIHATHNNAMWAGKTIVTNHLHSPNVRPFNDLRGRRYGVDTGTLAEPSGPQFAHYTEANPKNWGSGFAMLWFDKDGRLFFPELVSVWAEGQVEYRGKVWNV